MRGSAEVVEMIALELLAATWFRRNVVEGDEYDEADYRTLAVISEAWEQAGYAPDTLADMIPRVSRETGLKVIEAARYRRKKALLAEQAKGLRLAIRVFANAGLVTHRTVDLCRWPSSKPVDAREFARDLLALADGGQVWRLLPILTRHGVAEIPPRTEET